MEIYKNHLPQHLKINNSTNSFKYGVVLNFKLILTKFLKDNPNFDINNSTNLDAIFKMNLRGQTEEQAKDMLSKIQENMRTISGNLNLNGAYTIFNHNREMQKYAILEKFPSNFDISK